MPPVRSPFAEESFWARRRAHPPLYPRPSREGRLGRLVAGMRELDDTLRAVEAILFAAEEPLGEAEIALHLGAGADVAAALAALQGHYAGRGVELVERG